MPQEPRTLPHQRLSPGEEEERNARYGEIVDEDNPLIRPGPERR